MNTQKKVLVFISNVLRSSCIAPNGKIEATKALVPLSLLLSLREINCGYLVQETYI